MSENVGQRLGVPLSAVFGMSNQPSVDGICDPPSDAAEVVAEALADCAEIFPAASKAATVYVYVVDADRPVSEYAVVVLVPISVPPR
jgi:hypothetical protein